MKQLMMAFLALSAALMVSACGGKGGGGGGDFVTAPNSCAGLTYNHQTGQYHNAQGQVVACNNTGFNSNYLNPYHQNWNGQQYNGCSSWSAVYPGSQYTPIYIQGVGYQCMKVTFFQNFIPNWQSMYQYYGGFPSYAMNCQPGVNCPARCYGASANAGVSPLLWLGGTLALCF